MKQRTEQRAPSKTTKNPNTIIICVPDKPLNNHLRYLLCADARPAGVHAHVCAHGGSDPATRAAKALALRPSGLLKHLKPEVAAANLLCVNSWCGLVRVCARVRVCVRVCVCVSVCVCVECAC